MRYSKGQWTLRRVVVAEILIVCFTMLRGEARARPDYTAWQDQGVLYEAPGGSAYYPSVIYDKKGFGEDKKGFGAGKPLYKMWYSNGSGGVFVTESTDGLLWGSPTPITGLGGDAHHVQVVYDRKGFRNPAGPKYKIWYWDIDAQLYSINAIAYAESYDGIAWVNDQSLTQDTAMPLVTGIWPNWNRGSYGPIDVFYQSRASNTGSEPRNYSYVMYYDGTDGGAEVTGLAYSQDGISWKAFSGNPVLDKGSPGAWDADDAAYGTVYQDANGYHFWYSGGMADVHEGIGYASSNDGKTWTKDLNNPIFHVNYGVSYRNARVYI
ncbi:MAG: hypothetical protein HY709_00360, partial [Candidatus Latescibacteria bacterium]|nr:hypothetical protein [Candidatus Latescibacterota bacterium]